ncbi:hypothetical protein GALL_513140 [mine drainage metagenome]|uniref:Uncharacterized protein n=1 Tax=mine drainage metagenome TaxID=410659 RepID=A0A1J5P7B1_9ZZZZ
MRSRKPTRNGLPGSIASVSVTSVATARLLLTGALSSACVEPAASVAKSRTSTAIRSRFILSPFAVTAVICASQPPDARLPVGRGATHAGFFVLALAQRRQNGEIAHDHQQLRRRLPGRRARSGHDAVRGWAVLHRNPGLDGRGGGESRKSQGWRSRPILGRKTRCGRPVFPELQCQ